MNNLQLSFLLCKIQVQLFGFSFDLVLEIYANTVLHIAPDESFSSVRQPLSVSQRLGSYLADIDLSNKIRQEQHKPVRDEYKDFDEVWEALQRMKGTPHNNVIFNNGM